MAGVESEKLRSLQWNSDITAKNHNGIAEKLKEVDEKVKAMLKLIEEDKDSFENDAGKCNKRRPELIAHVEEFYHMQRLLADCYDHLAGESNKEQLQNSFISHYASCHGSPLVTPDQKPAHNKFGQQAVGFDLFLSSGGGSSDLSLKEGTDSSSASDSESDPLDSSTNKHSNPHVIGDGEGLYQRIKVQETDHPFMKEKVKVSEKEYADVEIEVQENKDYAALLIRMTEYGAELKESNKKLQLSEEEVARLKIEVKKNEAVTVLIVDLQAQLESAHRDLKVREADLEMEKGRVLELQKKVTELEEQVSDSNFKIGTLVEELEIASEKLIALKNITMLEIELNSEKRQVLELQGRIERYVADISERDQEIEDLKVKFTNAEESFSLAKGKLQSDISVLSEELAFLEKRVEESEERSKSLENEIRQSEAEKKEMKCLQEAHQIAMCNEVERLKADVAESGKVVEALNKNHDMLKLKYDMLVAEKDGLNAQVQTLSAEMSSRDNQIQQLQENLRRVGIEHVELIAGSESAWKLVNELKVRVGELEKEVERQRVVISERAEEKREAIRQLCFSLEHYRNGYQELREAFIGHKRCAVLASQI